MLVVAHTLSFPGITWERENEPEKVQAKKSGLIDRFFIKVVSS